MKFDCVHCGPNETHMTGSPGCTKSRMLVIFHDHCVDGFTAAWCAWLKYGDAAEYLPAKYGDAPPDVTGRDVLIVDFSYPRAQIIAMCAQAQSVVIYDHHKTAAADLADLVPYGANHDLHVTFDMDRSGAGITWDELHGPEGVVTTTYGVRSGAARPWLVDYVEDRDLWRFKIPASKEVNACLAVAPRTFQQWSDMAGIDPKVIADRGTVLTHATASYVDTMKSFARLGLLRNPNAALITASHFPFQGGGYVPIVNAGPIHASELLGALAEGHPFSVGWFQRADGVYQYSLRSRGESGADVSAIAKAFGGGGHRNAAGFESKERVDV